MEKINRASRIIEELLVQKQIVLSDEVELFLQINDHDCTYYFVDHATRIEFWLDEFDTEDLNISPVVSPSHLSKRTPRISQIKYLVHLQG